MPAFPPLFEFRSAHVHHYNTLVMVYTCVCLCSKLLAVLFSGERTDYVMPPKRSTPASRPHKGIDPLDRQRSAAKSKTHEEREGGDAALAPAPFRVPRVYELDAAYKFVFVILMGVAHYSLHGQVSVLVLAVASTQRLPLNLVPF